MQGRALGGVGVGVNPVPGCEGAHHAGDAPDAGEVLVAALLVQAERVIHLRVRHDLVKNVRAPLSFSETANVLALELAGGSRVMLRPSGTEPKIKLYFDVRVVVGDGEKVDAARVRGRERTAAIVAEFRALVEGVA